MGLQLLDRGALLAVSPAALSAYARTNGWSRQEQYREHSDVFTGDSLPEIIVPRTERLGDYASVVESLIETFAGVSDRDRSSVYRSLVTADRDVVSLRVAERDDGSVSLPDGVDLVGGARDLLLSAACSLRGPPRAVYRAGANREAVDLVKRMRLGQTEQGSFVVTLLTPVVAPPLLLDEQDQNAPIERRMTRRLVEALTAARQAAARAAAGESDAFDKTVAEGVSANLCEALVRILERFPTLDVGVSWARTRPRKALGAVVRFGQADGSLLSEAARSFRHRAPQSGVHLHGFVRLLKRGETDVEGTIRLATRIDGRKQSVEVVLGQQDYEEAARANTGRTFVVLSGDLERTRQPWRLLNPQLEEVLSDDGPDPPDA